MTVTFPKSVAVIGAGPCGSGFAKALIAENSFDTVQLFEKREDFGGLWNYTGDQDGGQEVGDLLTIPSENPKLKVIPLETADNKYVWKSPVYDTLDTNVPKDVMSYADSPFDESLPLFPHREDVRKYMKGYAEPLRNHTRFGTQIIDVRRNKDNTKWTVRSRPIVAETKGGTVAAGAESQAADVVEEYDAVVIATGNYELPYIPNRAGLTEWHAKYPTSVTNAKNYRNPQQFSNSKGKILVVGNSASANDICYQLATSLGEVVYKLKRSENVMPAGSSPLIKVVADVAKFDAQSKSVHLIDGTVLQDIEKVIFATGYLHSFPFFNQAVTDVPELVTDGKRIYGIYEHTLLYNYPNLAISGAARYILPTRTSESQGSWVAKIWSGKIPQPSKEAMANWETERAAKSDNAVHFHDLFFPEDVHYANRLNEDIVKVNTGLKPFLWSREQISIRGAIRAVKESYIAYKHDTGKLAKSYQELVDSGHLKKFILTDEEMKEHGF